MLFGWVYVRAGWYAAARFGGCGARTRGYYKASALFACAALKSAAPCLKGVCMIREVILTIVGLGLLYLGYTVVVMHFWSDSHLAVLSQELERTERAMAARSPDQKLFDVKDCDRAIDQAKVQNADPSGYDEAVRICRHVGAWGDTGVQYILGTWYKQGKHVLQNDEESQKWYLAAAMQGHVPAQLEMVLAYLRQSETAEQQGDSHQAMDYGMEAYGWFCVAQKQAETSNFTGFDAWTATRTDDGPQLMQTIANGFVEHIKRQPFFPIRKTYEKMCREYVNLYYKPPAAH
ncbi:sel1 repeat family protein [Micavibrio aeruginosavorus ARL-13]|uniref:Sel1 repeat family protein n=2 Tax=Micavibrio aeruginosavorus TaxID=349221 RepID=G2KP28_MICAA|nr:sel1 repeat family protein [Micavibrio aeruginosavorus ARL-13]